MRLSTRDAHVNSEFQFQLLAESRDSDTGLLRLDSRRLLTKAEVDAYTAAVEQLLEYRAFRALFLAADESFAHFIDKCDRVRNDALRLRGRPEEQRQAAICLNSLLATALSAFRAFVDHTQTRLSRRWGSKSDQVRSFRIAIDGERTTSRAYRILSQLRNFVQHCGVSIRMVAVDSWIENPPRGSHHHRVRIDCDAQDLLHRYDRWDSAEADIRELGAEVPLAELSAELRSCLARIAQAVLAVENIGYSMAGQHVVSLLSEVNAPGERGVVVKLSPYIEGKQEFSIIQVPMDVLRLLGMVKEESA